MAALTLLAAAVLAAAPGERVARWQPLIAAAAARCGVSEAWIARVMHAESRGRTMQNGEPIRSRKGAMGLMQLMPATWIEMRAALSLGDDPDLPADNIVAGACYLRRMVDRFGYPAGLAAYNAGPSRYADYLDGRRALPRETIDYFASTSDALPAPVATEFSLPRELLFAVRNPGSSSDQASPPAPSASGLFVALSSRN